MKKKRSTPREPSLLRQIVAIHFEQCKRRKAMRILMKQEWSVDFLTLLLIKGAKLSNQVMQLVVTSPSGITLTMTTLDAVRNQSKYDDDQDIFNKLDDSAAIDAYIRDHSVRR